MIRKIKVCQIGCGKMSKYTMRYVIEKGASIVSAFDNNPKIIGKKIQDIMETDYDGVEIQDVKYLNDVLKDNETDIAIITTMSFLNDLEEVIRICIKNKVNVITTCEEAFYASNSNPKLFGELDSLAKANNVTIVGCGYQDIFWGNLVSTMASSIHKISKIKGCSSYNVEDYGIALAKAHGAGLTIEEFNNTIVVENQLSSKEREEKMQNREFYPSYMWNVAGWLADKLNLHIVSIRQECVPKIASKNIHSDTLEMDIKEGDATGMSAIVSVLTEEEIAFEIECIGKVYEEGEIDLNKWEIIGEPDTSFTMEGPNTVLLTCADIVNRIPDVINSKSGFVPTCELKELLYRTKDLNEYVE